MTEILCPTCGKPNSDDHNFCDHCGAPLFSVDPLPPGSPSLRDEIFDDEDNETPIQSTEPLDESSRLDSYFSPTEPLEETPENSPQNTEPLDDFSRLDDLIPAPDPLNDHPTNGTSQPVDESDASSRLDDFFVPDEPLTRSEEESDRLDKPAFDPFLDPSARDELLGEDTPEEKDGGDWQYLTEPSTDDSLPEKTPPVLDHSDNFDFLSSLSDESTSENSCPGVR